MNTIDLKPIITLYKNKITDQTPVRWLDGVAITPLYYVATDGHKLMAIKHNLSTPPTISCILKPEILKLIKLDKNNTQATLNLTDSTLTYLNTTYSNVFMDAEYPDIHKVIPHIQIPDFIEEEPYSELQKPITELSLHNVFDFTYINQIAKVYKDLYGVTNLQMINNSTSACRFITKNPEIDKECITVLMPVRLWR